MPAPRRCPPGCSWRTMGGHRPPELPMATVGLGVRNVFVRNGGSGAPTRMTGGMGTSSHQAVEPGPELSGKARAAPGRRGASGPRLGGSRTAPTHPGTPRWWSTTSFFLVENLKCVGGAQPAGTLHPCQAHVAPSAVRVETPAPSRWFLDYRMSCMSQTGWRTQSRPRELINTTTNSSLDRRCGNCLRPSNPAGSDANTLCPACRHELRLARGLLSHMRTRQLDQHVAPMRSAQVSKINQSQRQGADQRAHEGPRPHRSGQAEVVEQPPVQLIPKDRRSTRVLVVDDEKDVRDTTVAILRAEGYVVVRAADGIEALERLRGRKIDVMLLDLRLPRMDGPALLEELDEPPAVVVCSAFGKWDEAEIRRRFGSTIVECLDKPVSPIRLIAATAAAAENRARAS